MIYVYTHIQCVYIYIYTYITLSLSLYIYIYIYGSGRGTVIEEKVEEEAIRAEPGSESRAEAQQPKPKGIP